MNTSKESVNRKEYVFAITSRIITILIGIVFSVISTRYLGTELKGTTSYIFSVVEAASMALTLGIHHAYPFYRNKYGKDLYIKTYVSMIMTIYALLVVVASAGSILLKVNMIIAACAILAPLYAYNRVLGYVFLVESPNRKYKVYVLSGIFEVLVSLFVYIYAPRCIPVAVLLMACMNFFQSIVYTKWAISEVGFTYKVNVSSYIEVFKYGFFPMLSLLLTNLNYRIDIIMLGNYGNVPIADIGIYGLAVQLADKAGIVTDTVQEVLLSHLAKDKKFSEVARVIRSCIFVTVVIACVFLMVGKLLIPFLYGEEFAGAYYVTSLCLVSPIVIIVFKMVAQYNIVVSRQKRNAVMLVIGIAINVVLNLLLVPRLGIIGAACGTVIGNTVCAIVFLLYFSRLSGIRVKDIVLIKGEDYKELKELVRKK